MKRAQGDDEVVYEECGGLKVRKVYNVYNA